jgi:hypothetical protein
MNLRSLLHHIHPARRPDINERQAMICLQEACRQICRDTLRFRGMLSISSLTDAMWTAGGGNESYLRPTSAQLAGLVTTDQAVDTETKTLESIRVLSAKLVNTSTNKELHLQPIDLSGLRIEATRMIGLLSSTAMPVIWADAQGALALWPGYKATSNYDKLTMEVAVCPSSQEFENVSLPAEAEAALVEEAIARAYEFVGKGQSFDAAAAHRRRSTALVIGLQVADGVGAAGPTISNHSTPPAGASS